MLTVLKSYPLNAQFVVCDIENKENGDVICIDTLYKDERNRYVHTIHDTWSEWFLWIGTKCADDKRFSRIWSHNGNSWDWLSFLDFLVNRHPECLAHDKGMGCVMAESSMIMMCIDIMGSTITLCDSLKLLRGSLDSLAKKFLNREKIKFDGSHEQLWLQNPDLFYKYLRNDTELLHDILQEAFSLIHKNVAPIKEFGPTIASTAMKIYRTSYMKRSIMVPTDDELRQLLRDGYRGGRVEVFKRGYHKDINVYDINSLYPSVMYGNKYPVNYRGGWTSHYIPGKVGLYRIVFNQQNTKILPILSIGGGSSYSGEGVYYTPEIDYFRQFGTFKVIGKGYLFHDCENIFDSYVDKLWKLRLTDKDGPLGEICKYLLNNLYGKFAQRPSRESLVYFPTQANVKKFLEDQNDLPIKYQKQLRAYQESLGIWSLEEYSECEHEHVGIAGMVTSYARVALYKRFMEANSDVVYCDTDSIHTSETLPIGAELGELKREFTGEGVYIGKKLYALRNGNDTKIRVKGVRVSKNPGDELGMSLSFDSLLTLLKDDSTIECHYQSSASTREVLRGIRKPCVFTGKDNQKKRTIRMLPPE